MRSQAGRARGSTARMARRANRAEGGNRADSSSRGNRGPVPTGASPNPSPIVHDFGEGRRRRYETGPRGLLRYLPGGMFIALGIAMPCILGAKHLGIVSLVRQSIAEEDVLALMHASIRLVLMNTVRAIPIYLGGFVLADSISRGNPSGIRHWLLYATPLIVIPGVYKLIELLYGIAYDFAMPAVLTIVGILAVLRLNGESQRIVNKAVIITQLLFGLEWLDVVPALSPFGFGGGELSSEVKLSAMIGGFQGLLNLVGGLFSIVLVTSSILVAKFMVDYEQHLQLVRRDKERQIEMERSHLEVLQARGAREMQALVHDLKTPLTAVQGLAEVVREISRDEAVREYADKILSSAERMNTMISQILRGDARRTVSAEEFVEYLKASLPVEKTRGRVRFSVAEVLPDVTINQVRLARALLNLIQNALDALQDSGGRVVVSVGAHGGDLLFQVEDDGCGIPPDDLDRVWEPGFSSKNSTGVGLSFVRDVVREHGGSISIVSEPGKGTVVTVRLPASGVHCHGDECVTAQDTGNR